MLNFARHESSELSEINRGFGFVPIQTLRKSSRVKILAEKISLPLVTAEVERRRLIAHLEKSLAQFSSTLVTGRVGAGKTTLAADFANRHDYRVAWYKIETTDGDWTVFLDYLTASLHRSPSDSEPARRVEKQANRIENSSVTEALAAGFSALDRENPLLIVLDDLHAVYDADWFEEFFNALLSLPAPNVRLLLIARAAPSFPLWRLRSKHALDVVDEKLLAFTVSETVELFNLYGLPENAARAAHQSAYGRIAKLREIAEKKAIR